VQAGGDAGGTGVAAGAGEHRDRGGDAEDPAELLGGGADATGDADLGRWGGTQGGGGGGGKGQPGADPGQQQRPEQGRVAGGGGRGQGEQPERNGLGGQSGGDEAAFAEPVGEAPGAGRDRDDRGGPGQQGQPDGQRAVAAGQLQVLGHQERPAEQAGGQRGPRAQRRDQPAVGEHPERQHRRRAAAFPSPERETEHGGCAEQDRDFGRGPPDLWAAQQGVDQGDHRGGGQHEPDRVEPSGRSVALAQPAPAQEHQGEADRDVDPEHPRPGQSLHDHPADQRADPDCEPGQGAPHSDDGAAARGRVGLGDQYQGQRHGQPAAGALRRPGGDEQPHRRRQGACRRRQREHGHPGQKHSPAAVALAERAAGQDQRGERKAVRRHRPTQGCRAGVQGDVDGGKRGGHHQRVQPDHERRDRGHQQGGPLMGGGPLAPDGPPGRGPVRVGRRRAVRGASRWMSRWVRHRIAPSRSTTGRTHPATDETR